MSIRRKRAATSLGASRLLGVSGLRVSNSVASALTGNAMAASVTFTGASVGSLIVVVVSHGAAYSRTITVEATGLTFTEAVIGNAATGNATVGIYYAISPDGVSRAVTATVSGAGASSRGTYAVAYVVDGADPNSPLDLSASTNTTAGGSTSQTLAGITTVTPGAMLFAIAAGAANNGVETAITEAGWTATATPTPLSACTTCAAYGSYSAAGATGDIDLTLGTGTTVYRYCIAAIRPLIG